MNGPSFALCLLSACGWLLPSPSDEHGWALRVQPLDVPQSLLTVESFELRRVTATLVNRTKDERKCLHPFLAFANHDLDVWLVRPDGKTLRAFGCRRGTPPLTDDRWKVPGGHFVSETFQFEELGYSHLPEPGEYEIRASMKTAEGVVKAPAVKLTAIDPPAGSILARQPVTLEGYQAKRPKEGQETAAVEQIKLGDRTWLFYRRFLSPKNGGQVHLAFRLAELPGKVDVKVEGAHGEGGPLTITYQTARDAEPTKLVIHSGDGRPWRTVDEETWQKRPKPKP
ncbi:MAG: hypothetical protein K2V38_24190 [Gemmataceae bacterium]|nr:hypothetical protein [Gemmataceae bacterium]